MTAPDTPRHTLIHLTDLHIGPPGGSRRDPIDTADLLERALHAVESTGWRPTALVFTGDLVEDGTAEQYRRLRGIVEPVAARLDAPALYLAGNHDNRAELRRNLLDRPPTDEPLRHTTELDGLRIVALDSTVPGRGYGLLDADQLGWLREQLRTPAPHGTVLAVHHPPLPTAIALASTIALRNRADLAEAIRGRDVRIVLAGHYHMLGAGTLAGVPVWTGGPIGTTVDALAPGSALRTVSNPTVGRIDLFDDCVVATGVPVGLRALTDVPDDVMAPRIEAVLGRLPE